MYAVIKAKGCTNENKNRVCDFFDGQCIVIILNSQNVSVLVHMFYIHFYIYYNYLYHFYHKNHV